jgi:hypothetical protein
MIFAVAVMVTGSFSNRLPVRELSVIPVAALLPLRSRTSLILGALNNLAVVLLRSSNQASLLWKCSTALISLGS